MSPFPTWTTDDVRAFLLGYGLSPETLTAVPLEAGNLALLLHADGQHLVLRRYSWTPEEDIAWELQLISFLTARGFPTPAVFLRADGALSADFLGRPAALFPYVVGHEADPQSPADAAQVADAIAELHLLTRGLHLPYARSRTDWAQLAKLEEMAARLRSPGLQEMATHARIFRADFRSRVAAVGGDLPTGIVHSDAHPGNALVDDAGRLVALLDFDGWAHEGELITDVASLLGCWATPDSWQGLKAEMVEAILRTYDQRRPLTTAEWELLPDFLLLYTLADTAGYVIDALEEDPTRPAMLVWNGWQRFQELARERGWEEMLRP